MNIPDEAVGLVRAIYCKYADPCRPQTAHDALTAVAPILLAAAIAEVLAENDHIVEGAGAYSSGFHYALQCLGGPDAPGI